MVKDPHPDRRMYVKLADAVILLSRHLIVLGCSHLEFSPQKARCVIGRCESLTYLARIRTRCNAVL